MESYSRNKLIKVDCAGVQFLSVMASYHHHSLYPHSNRRWSKADPSLILGSKIAPGSCSIPRPPLRTNFKLDTVSEKIIPMEPASRAFNISLRSVPALALTLSTLFGAQQAYADLNPTVQAGRGVQMELISSSVPSVDAILAKQLARRFREMSDEELVDILQQLLKASGGAPQRSQNAVDDGITPQDLVIKTESGQVDMKTAKRIREEVQVPEGLGTDTKVDINVRDRNKDTGTQPASGQGNQGIDKMIRGIAPQPQTEEENVQANKRTSEMIHANAKATETEDHDLPLTGTRVEKINGDAKLSGIQQKPGGENNTAPQTAEINDASGVSKSSVSGNVGATSDAHLSSRKPEEGTGEDENVTALLWEEWSRRAASQVVPESQASTSNVAEFWQSVQSYSKNVATEVVALTDEVFERCKVVVGIITTWSLFIVVAFYLGRFRASSRQDMSKSKEPLTKDQDNLNLPIVSSDGTNRRGLGQRPASFSKDFTVFVDPGSPTYYGKKEIMVQSKNIIDANAVGESYEASTVPTEGEPDTKSETAARNFIPSTSGQSPHRSIAGAREELARQVNDPSNSLRSKQELACSVGQRSEADDVIMSEMERVKKQQGGEKVFVDSNARLHPSTVSVTSLEMNGSKLQAAVHQPHSEKSRGRRQADYLDATKVENAGDEHPGVDAGAQGKPSAVLEHSFIGTSNGLNPDSRRATSPIRVDQAAENTDTGTNSIFQFNSPMLNPINQQKRADGHWEKAASSAFVQERLVSDKQVRQTDRLEGASPKQFVPEDESCREEEYKIAGWSKPELNSFVHDNDLWVRDADGVFIQRADQKEEGQRSKIRGSSSVWQDTPESSSSRAERTSLKVKNKDLPSTAGRKISRKQSRHWFDYRQLVIDSSEKFPFENQQELGTAERYSGPAAHGQQNWPLRYGSVRKISE